MDAITEQKQKKKKEKNDSSSCYYISMVVFIVIFGCMLMCMSERGVISEHFFFVVRAPTRKDLTQPLVVRSLSAVTIQY